MLVFPPLRGFDIAEKLTLMRLKIRTTLNMIHMKSKMRNVGVVVVVICMKCNPLEFMTFM